MLRIIIVGLWLTILAFSSFYIGIKKNYEYKNIVNLPDQDKLKYERSDVINIPIINHNDICGYIIAQFVYIIDDKVYTDIGKSTVTDYLNDALLENIYGKYTSEEAIDKINLNDLKTEIIASINSHFRKPYLKGLVIGHFTYYSLDVVKKAIGS